MPTAPLTLAPSGGSPYSVVRGHMLMLYRGAWIIDAELSSDDVASLGMPSGKCTVVFGGVSMTGTIDPNSSGVWGPTAMARIVAGAGAWSSSATAQQWHTDNGVQSQAVYSSVAGPLGETVTDLEPTSLGVDVVLSSDGPASAIFGDRPWFVDTTGKTFVGPRPPSTPDKSLVIREWDPLVQKATFSCDTILLPNTPLTDPRFGSQLFTAQNVEQVFDANGSVGWAWAQPTPAAGAQTTTVPTTLVDMLKAAVLAWTRTPLMRVYRYRLVQYQGEGPGGGPSRMALQAVTPSAGVPDLVNITPSSGMAGMVATLAPSQEVFVVFENADPTLPRVVGYSLLSSDGTPLGLPKSLTIDASDSITVAEHAGNVSPVARVNDTVVVAFPPLMQVAGTVSGAPFVGVLTITTPALGIVQTGSPIFSSG